MRIPGVIAALTMATLVGSAVQAHIVTVTVEGTVTFNAIMTAPLDAVSAGDSAVMSFQCNPRGCDGATFPECIVRCYEIIQPSFSLAFNTPPVTVGLLNPFPEGAIPSVTFARCFSGWNLSREVYLDSLPISQTPLRATFESYGIGYNYDLFNLWQDTPESALLDIAVTRITIIIPADLNGDCAVDLQDLANLLAHFGAPSGATHPDVDVEPATGDGDVDLADLALLLANFGTTCP
jgi:hypothetical protein